jgi:hypothetical protein
VLLERRTSNGGTEVCVDNQCVLTLEDGEYGFDGLMPGDYTIAASRMSYLRSQLLVNLPVGLLDVPDVTLLGGDINQDGHINLEDGTLIGQAWNSIPGAPDWDERADITDDDMVNLLDMVAVQFNWDRIAPGPWAGAGAAGQRAFAEREPVLSDVTQMAIDPPWPLLSGLGESAEMHIEVRQVTNLYAARVQLTFDPSVIQVRDADPRPSAPGVQIQAGDFLDPSHRFVLVNEVDNRAGTIDFAVTQLAPARARSGSGVLATVLCELVGTGSSGMQLTSVRLLDDALPAAIGISWEARDAQGTIR